MKRRMAMSLLVLLMMLAAGSELLWAQDSEEQMQSAGAMLPKCVTALNYDARKTGAQEDADTFYCVGYVTGAVDGFKASGRGDVTTRTTTQQVVRAFVAYAKKYPAVRKENAAKVIVDAAIDAGYAARFKGQE